MPKFAANLSMLFTELPFLERFAAAARAGFEAVEFLFPYEYAAGEIRQRLQENQLQLVLFNTPPGDVNAGEWGSPPSPGEARRPDAILSWRWVCLPARLPAGAYHGRRGAAGSGSRSLRGRAYR